LIDQNQFDDEESEMEDVGMTEQEIELNQRELNGLINQSS